MHALVLCVCDYSSLHSPILTIIGPGGWRGRGRGGRGQGRVQGGERVFTYLSHVQDRLLTVCVCQFNVFTGWSGGHDRGWGGDRGGWGGDRGGRGGGPRRGGQWQRQTSWEQQSYGGNYFYY